MLGFIVLFVCSVFIIWASKEQKQYFIDEFVLLKNVPSNPAPFAIIVLILVAIIIVGGVYFRMILKVRKGEIKRISAERNKLQKILTGRRLNSSDNNDSH